MLRTALGTTLASAFLVATVLLPACGKKKSSEGSGGNSSDAIADDSQIRWDQDYEVVGSLLYDDARTSRYKYVLEEEWTLAVTAPVNMRLVSGTSESNCQTGKSPKGIYYTLTSEDGLFVRSTDAVDQVTPPVAVDAFPGKIPPGRHTLTVRVYAEIPCQVKYTFRFPNPTGENALPPDADQVLDSDLTGSWEGSDTTNGVRQDISYTFASDHSFNWLVERGDIRRINASGKYKLDVNTTPKRLFMTVTSVQTAVMGTNVSVGSQLSCIYYPSPRNAAVILYLECSEPGFGAYPVDFGDRAIELDRTAGSGSPAADFELTKGGTTDIAIPDNDLVGTASVIEFATGGATLVDLGVQFTVQHANAGDLRVKLIGPDGTSVTLYERTTSTETTLSRSYGIYGSSFSPLTAFRGKSINGKWRIVFADESPEDTGKVTVAKLIVRGRN